MSAALDTSAPPPPSLSPGTAAAGAAGSRVDLSASSGNVTSSQVLSESAATDAAASAAAAEKANAEGEEEEVDEDGDDGGNADDDDDDEEFHGRRIIAEDPEWNLSVVESLTEICLRVVVDNFERNANLSKLPDKHRLWVLSQVSIDLPIKIAATLIHDDVYWQRRANAHFKNNDTRNHGGSWRQLYFEKLVQSEIEKHVPSPEADLRLRELLKLTHKCVQQLQLQELQCANTVDRKPIDPNPDHIDIDMVVGALPRLTQLSCAYRLKEIGMNFEWHLFGMTEHDCQSLARALRRGQLQKLSVRQSGADDGKVKLLCDAIVAAGKQALGSLDLSYNKLGEKCGLALASIVPQLTVLNLANNNIGEASAAYIAKALLDPACRLADLSLRLNPLGDRGGAAILYALQTNASVKEIDLSSTGMGKEAFQQLLALVSNCSPRFSAAKDAAVKRQCSVQRLNVSSNQFAAIQQSTMSLNNDGVADSVKEELGKQLWEAVQDNKVLTMLDVRSCDIPATVVTTIRTTLAQNGSS
ncbi:hypothetical protein RI367_003280 [Sorochytrium milnesiophthora]